jgi:hypothetical protein
MTARRAPTTNTLSLREKNAGLTLCYYFEIDDLQRLSASFVL